MHYLDNPKTVCIFDIDLKTDAHHWVFQDTGRAFSIPKGSSFVLIRALEIDIDLEPDACPGVDEWVARLLQAVVPSYFSSSTMTASSVSSVPASSTASSTRLRSWPPKLFADIVQSMETLHAAIGKYGEKNVESEFRRIFPAYYFVPSTVHRHVKFFMEHKDCIASFTGSTWADFKHHATSTASSSLDSEGEFSFFALTTRLLRQGFLDVPDVVHFGGSSSKLDDPSAVDEDGPTTIKLFKEMKLECFGMSEFGVSSNAFPNWIRCQLLLDSPAVKCGSRRLIYTVRLSFPLHGYDTDIVLGCSHDSPIRTNLCVG